jgi:hypothetical protein
MPKNKKGRKKEDTRRGARRRGGFETSQLGLHR